MDGLNQTEDGPEKVFVIRESDPAAARAVQAWLEASRIHGVPDQVLRQANDFLHGHGLYKAHFGVFPQQIPNVIREETHKGTPPPPAPPKLTPAPKPQEIGEGDGEGQPKVAPTLVGRPKGPAKRGILPKDTRFKKKK